VAIIVLNPPSFAKAAGFGGQAPLPWTWAAPSVRARQRGQWRPHKKQKRPRRECRPDAAFTTTTQIDCRLILSRWSKECKHTGE